MKFSESARKTVAAMTLGAGALLSTLGMTGTAFAAESDVPKIAVQYRASDLNTDAGAALVYRHIARAARQVCPDIDSRNLSAKAKAATCQREATLRAVRQINNPRLAAISGILAGIG